MENKLRKKNTFCCVLIVFGFLSFIILGYLRLESVKIGVRTTELKYVLNNLIFLAFGVPIHEYGHVLFARYLGAKYKGVRISFPKKYTPRISISLLLPSKFGRIERINISFGGIVLPIIISFFVSIIFPNLIVYTDALYFVSLVNLIPLRILQNDGYKVLNIIENKKTGLSYCVVAWIYTLLYYVTFVSFLLF